MSKNLWNWKSIAIITAVTVVGVLSPISANAWEDSSGPDEIVTVSVDLGDNPDDGGPDSCTGFGSLSIPLTNISVRKERKILKTAWEGDGYDDDNNSETPAVSDQNQDPSAGVVRDPRDLSRYPLDLLRENTRTNFVSQDFQVSFDADNCEVSDRQGYVWTERQPVERFFTDDGDYWSPVEMTDADGILGASTLRASANLFVDYSLFGVNRNDVKLYDDVHWEVRPQDDWNVQAWGTEYTNQNMPVIWGSGGEATTKASITIFGDVPVGKYRVKHGFTLDTGSFNDGPWQCFIGFCP
ncbi:hypothetical protein [Rhodoluna lacicola]|uniref:Uncharacterized protein n=1 Tax=Rhodoluna lacicola TaxID=529884 RepID=A0A060JPL5_9MICO|nr:hypothetical protein [Rhodoluna lacicola]AIC48114.1 hypothetical protein Rhola_00013250 [Rhodoluna lacicola]